MARAFPESVKRSPAPPIRSFHPIRDFQRIAVALWMGVLLAGCGSSAPPLQRPVVIVSVLPQAYFVERLAGDLVDIEVMIPPGASPSSYEPSIGQLRAMSEASLYVKVGHPNFPFELAWLDKLLSERSDLVVVDCAGDLQEANEDPHIWLSPGCVRAIAPKISGALADFLPERRHDLERNLENLLVEVDELDAEIHARLDRYAGREILVFHPAWSYFTREYGLKQVAIENDHKEPSSHELNDLIKDARRKGFQVIFVQPQMSRRSAELVASELDAEVVVLDPLARDWLSNMRHVAETIEECLSR
jgi:zinc transport system substrate-binding protein